MQYSDYSSSPQSNASSGNDSFPYRVVVAGGSYSGLNAVLNLLALHDGKSIKPGIGNTPALDRGLDRGLEITLIDERDGFLHTLGTPLCHVSKPYVRSFWKKFNSFKELKRKEVNIIQGRVISLDREQRRISYVDLESGGIERSKRYDYAILATGLRRDWPVVPKTMMKEDYVRDAEQHISEIEAARNGKVAIIGGGAVGVEVAAEIKNHHPDQHVMIVHSRNQLLSNESLPDEFKDRAAHVMREEGVEVVLNQRPKLEESNGCQTLTFADGSVEKPSFVIQAFSKWTPITEYFPQETLDSEGYVLVKPDLSFKDEEQPRHFTTGDIARVSGIKRAGAAMAMGRIAAVNIYSSLLAQQDPTRETEFSTFPDVPPMMALAVGKQVVSFGPVQGLKWGVEEMKKTFGDDLGWQNTLNFLGLTEDHEPEAEVGRTIRAT